MYHVALTVVFKKDAKLPRKATREQTINTAGGLHIPAGVDPRPVAKRISKIPWVDRVVATHIAETHVGTWRKGRVC